MVDPPMPKPVSHKNKQKKEESVASKWKMGWSDVGKAVEVAGGRDGAWQGNGSGWMGMERRCGTRESGRGLGKAR